MKETAHPEAHPSEVWLTNVFPELDELEGTDSFRAIKWRTKRRGDVAYDDDNAPIPGAYPVFVMNAELSEGGISTEHEQS